MKEPGIYPDIHINEYHASDGISSTGISLLLDCPARYFYEYIEKPLRGIKRNDTKATLLGRAVHCLVLEEGLFEKTFYVIDDAINLRTKSGKEAMALAKQEADGREVLRPAELEMAYGMANAILESSMWNKIQPGKVEHSIFWDAGIYNTRLRSRPDFYNDDMIIDIKTTDSINSFSRSIYNYGYHRQAAMQIDGLYHFDKTYRDFGFLVVENKAPYLTACFVLNHESVSQGRQEYLNAASKYFVCMREAMWPGYEEDFQEISIPSWAIKEEF